MKTPSTSIISNHNFHKRLPGVLVCIVIALIAFAISQYVPTLSALIIAIVFGILLCNLTNIPTILGPGITWSSKYLLRAGIVLLGFQLSLKGILALGLPMVFVAISVVGIGIIGTVLIGAVMKIKKTQTLLIACGFSICGAAAVAGIEDLVEADEEDTITAIALVVLFGTLMIPIIPFLTHWWGLNPEFAGKWAGASVHEVAQVVAIGGTLGPIAMNYAVVVKLTRVLMLAPVAAILNLKMRHAHKDNSPHVKANTPPIVPVFILGFIGMVILRSLIDFPQTMVHSASVLQTILLTAAMFGLGCGVRVKKLMGLGWKPLMLAGFSTILVTFIGFGGVALTS
ncbi:MAG: YeiH family protein [Rothia sp. (in: high G+C Gram-positive bacteria)]|nr:YeiH family protein [Rothia sp. (in: high G+C Gram-positive bacteria)]